MIQKKKSAAPVVLERAAAKEPRRANSHLAGEFFVAAELCKRGYEVALTMGNAKAVDLFVERDGRSLCIQVKAISHKRNVGWPLPMEKEKILDGVIYVCVVLNDVGTPPSYYVLPPDVVRERGVWYSTRAILDIGRIKNDGYLDAWRYIDQHFEQ